MKRLIKCPDFSISKPLLINKCEGAGCKVFDWFIFYLTYGNFNKRVNKAWRGGGFNSGFYISGVGYGRGV